MQERLVHKANAHTRKDAVCDKNTIWSFFEISQSTTVYQFCLLFKLATMHAVLSELPFSLARFDICLAIHRSKVLSVDPNSQYKYVQHNKEMRMKQQ
jgi:hypothetical protein